MIVAKFGGSSVYNAERIREVFKILKGYQSPFTVVFSAFGGVTDQLIEISKLAANGDNTYLEVLTKLKQRHLDTAYELWSFETQTKYLSGLHENLKYLDNLLQGVYLVMEASIRTMDYVLSFGERNSAYIISAYLEQEGLPTEYLDARDIIKTDKTFGNAKVDFELTNSKIINYYQKHRDKIQVVTGFISSARGGLTTTLGRGGSDYTASILGAALNAKEIHIWTDVDGVLTADPRRVKKAFTIPVLSYAEAMEMSHFGAKVIYPPTIQPALNANIPLYIKNTFNPGFIGSRVDHTHDPMGPAVKGISSMSSIALLTLQGSGMVGVPGIAARLFGALAQTGINIILITQGSSEHSISFAVSPHLAEQAKSVVERAFDSELSAALIEPVKIESSLSVVAIIGENMRYRPGIAGRLFSALGVNGINVIAIAQGSSELNISVVIQANDESKALNALHQAFFLSDLKVLNLFMIGTGLIGKTLIKQIQHQKDNLKKDLSLEIQVNGLANTKKMVFANNEPLDLRRWTESLAAGATTNVPTFIQNMDQMNLPNSIFIDNTASSEIPKFYPQILSRAISICTPNKLGLASDFKDYQNYKQLAAAKNAFFRYETTVGAGLPVISTLKDLINSGDRIIQIDGVLSGSLSFIFNTINDTVSFSEAVNMARDKGYTEPDPRVDLSLTDVKRKVVILAREMGLTLNVDHITNDELLSPACYEAVDWPELFDRIKDLDIKYNDLIINNLKENKKLRVVAVITAQDAKISLISVSSDHPLYSLAGSDNMIVFTSERYKDRPLVVRGPGAGADVTAAGLFAEIISLGNKL